jgi:ribosomal protein S18 acetylase RimI-like enzyme
VSRTAIRKTPITIRAARSADCKAVLDLWKRSGIRSNVSDEAFSVRNRLRRDRDLFLVALDKSRVIATLIAGWDGWRGTMARLAVDPTYRRQGIAQRLLAVAEGRLRTLGAKRIGALVFRDNETATQFWRAAGYRPESNITRFVKDLDRKRR